MISARSWWSIASEHRELIEDLLFEIPLYARTKVPETVLPENFVEAVSLYGGTRDAYCPECKQTATFKLIPTEDAKTVDKAADAWSARSRELQRFDANPWMARGIFEVHAQCTRKPFHTFHAFFRLNGVKTSREEPAQYTLMKVGQIPSMQDMRSGGLEDAETVLGDEKLKELKSARTLAAHGYSVGAFTYLRRVFEWVIQSVADSVPQPGPWSCEEFEAADMPTRIALLRGHLPAELVSNADLYKVLSEGVHNLNEATCAQYYPTVEKGLVLIVDEMARSRKQKVEQAEYKKAIQQLRERLGNKAANSMGDASGG